MTYDEAAQDLTRTPVSLTVIDLDYCGRLFGSAPCLATGEPCYNTFHTCKYKAAYLKGVKSYEFTNCDAPLPFIGPRPYQKSVTLLATEIGAELTIKGRVKIEFYDEPDTDVGIDPYVDQRSSIQGTFWKKLLARNPNYKGRSIRNYDGFLGIPREEYRLRTVGTIDNITIKQGVVTVEAVDGLKKLAEIDIPPKLDIKLVIDRDAAVTELTVTSLDGLDAAGHIRIGDEIISYGSLDVPTLRLMACTRGAFGTTAATHAVNDRVDKVRYYPTTNPFDLLKTMLTDDCGLVAGIDFAAAAFDYWRDWPGGEIPVSSLIVEPIKAEQLYFELCDLLDCSSWVGEDLLITIRRNLPNEPDRSYLLATDDTTISGKSGDTDLNDASRFTQVILYWDKSVLGKDNEIASYGRGDIGIDPDAESPNDYNEEIDKTIYCRWLNSGYLQSEILDGYIQDFVLRRLLNLRDARPIINISVELKDGEIKTGDYLIVQTNELQTPAGFPISERFQVVKREPKGATINLKIQQLGSDRLCFIAPDDAPDYDTATASQREYGYITDDSGTLNDGPGYVNW